MLNATATLLAHGDQLTADEFIQIGLQIVGVAGLVIALAVGRAHLFRRPTPPPTESPSRGSD